MKKRAWIISGFCLVALLSFVTIANAAPDNGAFGSYVVGTFDLREGHTVIQLVNPTPAPEDVCVALFNPAGGPLTGRIVSIKPNGLSELNVKEIRLRAKLGVVKAIVREPASTSGIVGFQRFVSDKTGIAVESNFASVPLDLEKGEYEKVWDICKKASAK